MKPIIPIQTAILIISFAAFMNRAVAQDNNQPQGNSYVKIKTMKIVNGDTIVTEREYKGNGDMQIEDTLGGNGFSNFSFRSFNGNQDSSFYKNFGQMQDMFKDFNFGGNDIFPHNFDFPGFQMPQQGFDVDSMIKEFNFRQNDSLFPSLGNNDIIIKSYKDRAKPNDSLNKTRPDMDMQIFGRNDQGQQVTFRKKITIVDNAPDNAVQSKTDLPVEIFPNPGDGFFNMSFQLDPKNETDIVISDMSGNQMLKETMEKSSGMYTRQFDMKDYAKGNYVISIKQGKKTASRQIIIE